MKKIILIMVTLIIIGALVWGLGSGISRRRNRSDSPPLPWEVSERKVAGRESASAADAAALKTPTPAPSPTPEADYEELRLQDFSEPNPDFSEKSRTKRYIYNGSREGKLIALTYDDGPHPTYTRLLLDLLRKENVPATFFLLGKNVAAQPEIAREITAQGCEIGIHTFTHPDLRKLSTEKISEELSKSIEEVCNATGVTPRIFRPPYGSSNEHVARIAYEMKLDIFYWDIDTDDYRSSVTAEQMIQKIMKDIRGGAIILMHDRGQKQIETTARIIQPLREQGYEFVTCSRLMDEVRLRRYEKSKAAGSDAAAGANRRP